MPGSAMDQTVAGCYFVVAGFGQQKPYFLNARIYRWAFLVTIAAL